MAENSKRQVTQHRCKTSALTPMFFRNENAKYNTHCWYCGKLLFWYPGHGGRRPADLATKDHLVPRCKGGRGAENLVPACYGCNVRKADLTLEEYRFQRFGPQGGIFWAEKYERNHYGRGNAVRGTSTPILLDTSQACVQ